MNQNKLFLNVEQKFNDILEDLAINHKDVFLRYNYFTHKYKGDRLNDVNVGLFMDDGGQLTAQIFVRNKTGYMRGRLLFNREGNKITDYKLINCKING